MTRNGKTYSALQFANAQPFQNLPRFIAVSHVLKRLGRILAAGIEQDFFPTTVFNAVREKESA